MKRTPAVHEVCLLKTHQGWFYFSVALISVNCWKLQLLPTLGENNITAYHYTCAYHSRHTLKKLELSFGVIGSKDFCALTDFTTLETLEVHKNVIKGLYNFTPQNNDELLALVTEFSSIQNLYIFGKRDKIWLNSIDNPLAIDTFFSGVNLITEYEIMMPGDTENQNHINFKGGNVATFYGGSTQSTPLLKYATMCGQSYQDLSDKLRVLDEQDI